MSKAVHWASANSNDLIPKNVQIVLFNVFINGVKVLLVPADVSLYFTFHFFKVLLRNSSPGFLKDF